MKKTSTSKLQILGLLVASSLLAGSALAQTKDKVTLMLNWYATGVHAPFPLGKDKGYFAKEGIDLEIVEGRGSGPTVQAVAARNVTFGLADITTMMKLVAKGAPVKAVGVELERSPFAVISLSEKKITTPADLKGKTLAMTAGDSPSQAWPLFMKRTNLKEGDFKVINGDAQTKLNAVINGQADALLGFATDQVNQIESATKKPVSVIMFADQGVDNSGASIVANLDTLKSQPDLVRRFMRAATLAAEETEKNPAAAIDALLKQFPKAGTLEALMSGLKIAIPLFHTPETRGQRPFRASAKAITDTVATMVQIGGIEVSDADPAKYYTNDFLP